MAKYLDDSGLALLWDKVKARDNSIVNNSTVYGAVRDGAGNTISTYYIPVNQKGANNGVATLGNDGKIPSTQLPSYVDDVLEYNNLASFPSTGEAGKIYVAKDTNKTYRWSGTQYTEISASIVIGTTSGTAFDGARGVAVENGLSALDRALTVTGTKTVKQAEKAEKDGSGNVITTTYAKKADYVPKVGAEPNNFITTTIKNLGESGQNFSVISEKDNTDIYNKIATYYYDVDNFGVIIESSNSQNQLTTIDVDGFDRTIDFTTEIVYFDVTTIYKKVGSQYKEILDESMALTTAEINAILV